MEWVDKKSKRTAILVFVAASSVILLVIYRSVFSYIIMIGILAAMSNTLMPKIISADRDRILYLTIFGKNQIKWKEVRSIRHVRPWPQPLAYPHGIVINQTFMNIVDEQGFVKAMAGHGFKYTEKKLDGTEVFSKSKTVSKKRSPLTDFFFPTNFKVITTLVIWSVWPMLLSPMLPDMEIQWNIPRILAFVILSIAILYTLTAVIEHYFIQKKHATYK